jgi:hypothetical protein
MKTILIPHIKTNCGEVFYGSFSYHENKINLELFCKGSQLLDYICNYFIKIVNNKPIRYLKLSKRIFWRINTLNINGSRKEMVDDTFDSLFYFIQKNI